MANPWDSSVKAAAALGNGGGGSAKGGKRKSKVLSQAHFRKLADVQGATGGAVDESELPEIAKRALKGEFGAKRAGTALANIAKSDMSKGEKKKWKEYYENGGETPSGGDSLLHKLTHNPVTDAMGTGLMLIDKPKRAVVATLQELDEEFSGLEDDGKSWADNVLHEADYGFGDYVEQSIKTGEKRKGSSGDLARFAREHPNVGRGLGLVGDIALDPTSYVGAGAVAKGAKGAKGAVEGTELAVKGGARLSSKDLARRAALASKKAADAGDVSKAGELESLAARLLKRGTGGASEADLAEVGARGGLRLGGKELVGQDKWSKVTRLGSPVKEKLGDSAAMRGLTKVVGDDALTDFRLAMRSKDSTDRQVIDSLLHIDAKKGGTRVANRMGAKAAVELEGLLKRGRKAKLGGDVLHGAVSGDLKALEAAERAAPGLAGELRQFFSGVRVKANVLGADEWIPDSGLDYSPSFLTDEASDLVVKKSRSSKAKGAARSFRKRAAKSGDEFGDKVLGSDELHALFSAGMVPDSRAAIRAQVEGLLKQWNPGLKQVYSNDMYTDAGRYLKGVSSAAATQAEARGLVERGVAVRPELGLEDALKAVEGKMTGPQRVLDEFVGEGPQRADGMATLEGEIASLVRDRGNAQVRASRGGRAIRDAQEAASVAWVDDAPDAADLQRVLDDKLKTVEPRVKADLKKVERLGTAADEGRAKLAAAQEYDLIGPKRVQQAAEKVAKLQPKYDSYKDAIQMARDPLGSTHLVDQMDSRLQEVVTKLGDPNLDAQVRSTLEVAVYHRRKAIDTAQRLVGETDVQARRFMALNVQADELAAQVAEGGHKGIPMDKFISRMRSPAQSKLVSDVLGDAFTSMAEYGLKDYQLSPFHMDAMVRATEVAKDPGMFLRFVDQANRFFKTYAIMTPGFHVRNSIGAMFNNFVAGVEMGSYREVGLNLKKFRAGGIDAVDARVRPIFAELDRGGFFHDNAQVASELGEFGGVGRQRGKLTDMLPGSKPLGPIDNPVSRLSRETGDRVEKFQRTVLAYDRMKKGATFEEAWDAVSQMHFDYSDLSKHETGVVKRIIPFWTWTSRNFPLQLEMVMRQPKMYQRFGAMKAALTDEDGDPELVPSWIKDGATAIHTGGDDYLTLDLPFAGIDEQTRGLTDNGPMALLQNAAPLVKTPLEIGFGKQSFNNIPITDKRDPAGMPASWEIVPGLVPILKTAGLINGDRSKETGRYLISNKSAYIIEQALPLAGRARRLAPSEKKYQQRALASWMSFFGVGFRQVTDADKQNETWRRGDTLTNRLDRFKETEKQDDE